MINLSLNENEAKVLLNLIDISVKATGIQAAEAGLHFSKMILNQLKPSEANGESINNRNDE